MKKFRYISDRWSGKPDEVSLYEDKPERAIHLRTFSEHHTLFFDHDLPAGRLQLIYNVLKQLLEESGSINLVCNTMRDMATKTDGAYIAGELKQGFSHMAAKQDYWDKWKDGLTFEDWCGDEQIAKEFYAFGRRPSPKTKILDIENDTTIQSIKDLLNNEQQ